MPSLRLYSLKTHPEDPPRMLIHTANDILHRVFAEGRELLKSDLPPVEVETQSSPELQWETPICEQHCSTWRLGETQLAHNRTSANQVLSSSADILWLEFVCGAPWIV